MYIFPFIIKNILFKKLAIAVGWLIAFTSESTISIDDRNWIVCEPYLNSQDLSKIYTSYGYLYTVGASVMSDRMQIESFHKT